MAISGLEDLNRVGGRDRVVAKGLVVLLFGIFGGVIGGILGEVFFDDGTSSAAAAGAVSAAGAIRSLYR